MRCVYFIPGNQPDRVRSATEHRPDAVVIDLEATVPPAEVPTARAALGDHVAALRDAGQRIIMVRTREIANRGLDDVELAAAASVDAVVIPKADPAAVSEADARLSELSSKAVVVPILETPKVIAESLDLLSTSPRTAAVIGGSGTRNGDLHRTLGFEWSSTGTESLFVRSQILLHARAVGLEHIIGCAWAKVADRDGLRSHARGYKSLGYTGYVAVHPSQIDVIHDVFTPSADEIAYAHRVLDAMREAEQRGIGLVQVDGELQARCAIDHAERVLRLAQAVPA